MRILHVLTQKPGHTGSGVYLRALLAEAQAHGDLTAAVVGIGPNEDPELENVFPVEFESDDLPFPVVGMSDVMPYRSTTWSSLDPTSLARYRQVFQRTLQKAVTEFQPEVIHCHHLWVLTALTRELFPHHRVVCSCHGTGLRQAAQLPDLFQQLRPSLERLDRVFALTRDQVGKLPLPPQRVEVTGSGFREQVFKVDGPKPSQPFRVLYAGKLSRSKGVFELLEAVAPLLGEHYELALAGGGHGSESEAIEARARAVGAKLLGRLDHQALAGAMNRAHLFALPSYYEGLPLVLVEALACGCRLVVTELPGVMEWLPPSLRDNLWVTTVALPPLVSVDRPDPAGLPDFVERLRGALVAQQSSNPEEPRDLSEFIERQSWRGLYQRMRPHYKQQL